MKLYVGTYHKYNCGSIFGKWLNLDDFSDAEEFYLACYKIHRDEKDPEFMFQDYEADYGWEDSLYCECSAPSKYWEIKEALQKLCVDEDVFSSFVSICSESASAELVEKCLESYQGYYDSLSDYAETFCEETGMLESVPQDFRFYIDYEKMARDWSYSGDVDFVDGYVFQRC